MANMANLIEPVRVVLAEDYSLVRAGLRSLLENIPFVSVVGEAEDGREAVRLVEENLPSVVLMDAMLPKLNGIEATARIVKSFPRTRVLILSMYLGEEHVRDSLRAGATGLLSKSAAPGELEVAIRAVWSGEFYISPSISERFVEAYQASNSPREGPLDRLTPRQREVLQLVAEGHSTKEIAGLLKMSPKTVEYHRAQLMERLETHDVPSLVRFAMRGGLIPPEI